MFDLTASQRQVLQGWKGILEDADNIDWYEGQKRNSEEIRRIMKNADFEKGQALSLKELYEISKLLTEHLGNTALSIIGEKSIFESNDLEVFNDRLRNLLFGKDPIVDRVDSFILLKGVGTMTVSQFLCLFDQREYAFYAEFMLDVFDRLSIDNVQMAEAADQAETEFGIVIGKHHWRTREYFKYFIALREIKSVLSLESYLQVQNLFWRIYSGEEIDTPTRNQIESAIRLIGKQKIKKKELLDKIEEMIGDEKENFRADWREVTWTKICEEWAEKVV